MALLNRKKKIYKPLFILIKEKIRDKKNIRDKKGGILDTKTSENLDIMNHSHSHQMWILTAKAENILKKHLRHNVNIYWSEDLKKSYLKF